MRKIAAFLALVLVVACFSTACADEILFRGIPWGTNFTAVKAETGFSFFPMHGEIFKTFSVDAVLLGDYDGIKFEYTDVNLIANTMSSSKEQTVAGYTTSDVSMYFAYVPVNGAMVYEDENTALYGARYTFAPMDIDKMAEDLIGKLSSLYGEPTKTSADSDFMKNEYKHTYWEGDNETVIVLREQHAAPDSSIYKDEIQLAYAWREGDTLLQNASDTIKASLASEESSNYGNSDTSGL